eukprot:scaffold1869_cov122-Cylindrotheca_fusiformis.AAC.43
MPAKYNAVKTIFVLAAALSLIHISRTSSFYTDNSILATLTDSIAPTILSQSTPIDEESIQQDLTKKQIAEGESRSKSNQELEIGKVRELELHTDTKNETYAATVDFASKVLRNQTTERIAIVMRSMDPVKPIIMERLLQIAHIFDKEEFKNYDMYLLLDQTRRKTTTTQTVANYLRQHNASHLRTPKVFGVTEQMILQREFPALAKGYVPGPLIDGTKGQCCGKPLMWQLLMPTFVTFVHYHQEYDYTWVFEDDVWAIGMPLVEIFQIWDSHLKGKNASLVGTKLGYGNMPYSLMTKDRHTEGFRDILVQMKATGWQHKNRTLLRLDNQTRSWVWNKWGGNVLPNWSCMSDVLYRHSREFGNYVYGMVQKNIYQFAECYQMPLAWYGGFKITDVKKILPNVEGNYGDGRRNEKGVHLAWEKLLLKKEYDEAEYALRKLQKSTNVSALIYHRIFVPPNGKEYRTKRNHSHICSIDFDLENDVNRLGTCPQMLKSATENATAWIFLGNFPMFKIANIFKLAKSSESVFDVLMDDKQNKNKVKSYYEYKPVNKYEWRMKYGHSVVNRTEPAGRVNEAICDRCGQFKLQSKVLDRTLEYLLVESSRDVFFSTASTTTSQETVAKWISEHYHDRQKTVCVFHIDGYEMNAAPWRTTSDFLKNTKKFHEMLESSCGTIIRFGFLRFASSRDIREVVAWDEGARDLVIDSNSTDGYFIDVSNAKKAESRDRYSRLIWRMFVDLMGLGPALLPTEKTDEGMDR